MHNSRDNKTFGDNLMSFVLSLTDSNTKVDYNTELFADNIINSINVLDLIAFVEHEFNIQIKDEDIILDNFSSINNIINKFGDSKYA